MEQTYKPKHMKISLSRISLLFCLALFLGVAVDRIVAQNQFRTEGDESSQALLVFNLGNEGEVSSESLVNKWINVQGELTDIQIDSKGEIVLKINTPLQSKGLSCFFSENIRSRKLDQLYSNQKVQLTGLCKKVGKKLVLVDCKII